MYLPDRGANKGRALAIMYDGKVNGFKIYVKDDYDLGPNGFGMLSSTCWLILSSLKTIPVLPLRQLPISIGDMKRAMPSPSG